MTGGRGLRRHSREGSPRRRRRRAAGTAVSRRRGAPGAAARRLRQPPLRAAALGGRARHHGAGHGVRDLGRLTLPAKPGASWQARVAARPADDMALNVHTMPGGAPEAKRIFSNVFFSESLAFLPRCEAGGSL